MTDHDPITNIELQVTALENELREHRGESSSRHEQLVEQLVALGAKLDARAARRGR